jgi:hypothetical protein
MIISLASSRTPNKTPSIITATPEIFAMIPHNHCISGSLQKNWLQNLHTFCGQLEVPASSKKQ